MMTIRPKITVVYYSEMTKTADIAFEKMIKTTSGLKYNDIDIIRYNKLIDGSLGATYNDALRISKSRFVLFINPQVKRITNNWAEISISEIERRNFGILGTNGIYELSRAKQQGFWFKDVNDIYSNFVQVNDHPFSVPVVAVTFTFMVIAKDKIKSFFPEIFKGTSFSDIGFCILNYEKHVKIGVLSTKNIQIRLTDNITEFEYNRKLFLKNYRKDYISPIEIYIPKINIKSYGITNMVHVIILTKNKNELVTDCINSILTNTSYPNYHIWLADTGSSSYNKNKLREIVTGWNVSHCVTRKGIQHTSNAKVTLLEFSDYNYSKNNNDVVKIIRNAYPNSDNDFILFCNNDVKLLNDCITGCIMGYVRLEKKGLKPGTIGIRLHYGDDSIQHLGIKIKKSNNRIFLTHKYLGERYHKGKTVSNCIGNTGAFMFTKFSVFSELGMFNEEYNDCCQDVEFNLKCILSDLANYNINNLVAYHYESQTRREDKEKGLNEKRDWTQILLPFILRNLCHLEHHFD